MMQRIGKRIHVKLLAENRRQLRRRAKERVSITREQLAELIVGRTGYPPLEGTRHGLGESAAACSK